MWEPMFDWAGLEIKNSDMVYQGHYKVIRHTLRFKLFDGAWSPWLIREQVTRKAAVAVLLFDPQSQQLLLVEQCRFGLIGEEERSPWMLELVAGLIDEGETMESTARREAWEEAGIVLDTLMPVMRCHPSPGGFSECAEIVYAPISIPKHPEKALQNPIFGLGEEGENIRLHTVSLKEAVQLLEAGRITTATAIMGIQWLQLNYAKHESSEGI